MTRIGVVLMVGSLPLWLVLPILPFVGISTGAKAMAATAVVVIAELMFWGGAVLAGPAAVRRLKGWWRRSSG
ncbi:MAG TPA: transporter suffix domain-containing protein [Acidobacteria bacterium]|nr:transporter suffix domain-containing protein [Acidobacteriota bacterium]